MQKKNLKKSIFLILALFLVGLFAFKGPGDKYFTIAKNLDIFATLFKEVNTYYVDDVNPNKLIKTGIDAMLRSLDPYTNYIPEDEIEDYRTMTTGEYGGIGAIIGKRDGKNMVLMPYKGFPAQESGLKIGDQILKIDGVDVTEKSISEISQLLKGQANTKVTLTIKRHGKSYDIPIEITRKKITVDNVPYYGKIKDEIGYIKLENFTTGAGQEVQNAVKELKSSGAKKIILDLRGNPGGLLSESVNVSNTFVPKGSEVVSTKGKVTDWNKTYKALDQPVDVDIPLAILTNSRSASAAEIVSGVVQDYDRGVLVGEKTFGKGLVQATRPLTYNSQLKITTAKYYIPSGRCIQAINYSDREADGSVGQIPDSLKSAFKTENGRTVYDGGGIKPDLNVPPQKLAPITQSLENKGLIFRYATEFYYDNKSIQEAMDFSISEEEYTHFTNWLEGKNYDYTTEVEKNLGDLVASAKNEKYYQQIEKEISSLREEVKHNKNTDLQTFKEEIKSRLEEEIAKRYYLYEGEIKASFDNDTMVQTAIDVLNDKSRHKEILNIK